jgi:hypothetical protein
MPSPSQAAISAPLSRRSLRTLKEKPYIIRYNTIRPLKLVVDILAPWSSSSLTTSLCPFSTTKYKGVLL